MRNEAVIPWWLSIKYRLLIFGIIMSILPLSALGYLNVQAAKSNLQQSINLQNRTSVRQLAGDFESLIGGQITHITTMSRISGEKLLNAKRIEQEGVLYSLLKEAPYLEEISLVNNEGRELARASRRQVVGNELRELNNTEAFLSLVKGQHDWSRTFLDSYGQVRLEKAVPIKNMMQGGLIGGLIFEMSLRGVVEQLAQKMPPHQGRLFVVDNAGNLVGHQDFSQVLRQTDVTASQAVKEFLQGNYGEAEPTTSRYHSYDGTEVLGVFAPVKGLNWAVVQEVPVKNAFQPIDLLTEQLILSGIIMTLLVTGLSIFFGVRFSASLHSLERGVEEIRKGNLDYEIQVQEKNELGRLGEIINGMRRELLTRRKQEQALCQVEKLSSLGLLASGVAHEVNNPLGVMLAYAQDLQERLEEEGAQKIVQSGELADYLQVINKQAKRCKEITANLLSFAGLSKQETGQINLRQTVESTLKLLKYKIAKAGIKTEVQIPPELPTLTGNVQEVQQVLLNLVTNALDALKPGGKLSITAGIREEKIVLEVTDNGCGIRPEHLKHIFDPFFTTKEPGKGTGLGLSICYSIMQRLGGTIEVASEPGQGTTFSLYFPLEARSQGLGGRL